MPVGVNPKWAVSAVEGLSTAIIRSDVAEPVAEAAEDIIEVIIPSARYTTMLTIKLSTPLFMNKATKRIMAVKKST